MAGAEYHRIILFVLKQIKYFYFVIVILAWTTETLILYR